MSSVKYTRQMQVGSQLDEIFGKLERPIHANYHHAPPSQINKWTTLNDRALSKSLNLLQQTFATGQNSPSCPTGTFRNSGQEQQNNLISRPAFRRLQRAYRLSPGRSTRSTASFSCSLFLSNQHMFSRVIWDHSKTTPQFFIELRAREILLQKFSKEEIHVFSFCQSVHNVPPLRWLLYSVLLLTSKTSLVHLHIHAAERHFESGNVRVRGCSRGVVRLWKLLRKIAVLARRFFFFFFCQGFFWKAHGAYSTL
ncbi:hypothetical protein BJ741DRAFT_255235 [Chytriomyces cf. hyalinus JEL632]|nr:hypothetical protein BJ741DRAFT_255235 [Chytriomyces cf. hyalinus JEL632]